MCNRHKCQVSSAEPDSIKQFEAWSSPKTAGFRAYMGLGVGQGKSKCRWNISRLEACLFKHIRFTYIPTYSLLPSLADILLDKVPAVNSTDILANSIFSFVLHEQRPWLKYGARRVIISVRKTIDLGGLAGQTQRTIQAHWNS